MLLSPAALVSSRSSDSLLGRLAFPGLAKTLIATATIMTVLGCDGDSTDQDKRKPNATDSGNQSGSTIREADGDTRQDTPALHQSFTITGDESQNAYTSLRTVVVAPRALSGQGPKKTKARTALLDGLRQHKGTKLTPSSPTNKMYCLERLGDTSTTNIPINKEPYVNQTYPCAFFLDLLDPYSTSNDKKSMHFIRGGNAMHFHRPTINEGGEDAPDYIYDYGHIKEAYRLFVVLDSLKYFDGLSQAKHIFKPAPPLKVILQLAYTDVADVTTTDSTVPTAQAIKQRLQKTYPDTDMQSFLFFALTAGQQPNYQAIATALGGRTFAVLDQAPAAGAAHPITTAMTTITTLIKGYAQGYSFHLKAPITTLESITLNDTPLNAKEYLFRDSTIYVLKELEQGDVIKVSYRS